MARINRAKSRPLDASASFERLRYQSCRVLTNERMQTGVSPANPKP